MNNTRSYYFNSIEEFNLSIFKISKEYDFNLRNVEIPNSLSKILDIIKEE